MDIGKILALARSAAGLSQAQMARDLGIVPSHLCDIESGRRSLPLKYVEHLPLAVRKPVAAAMRDEALDLAHMLQAFTEAAE
jgi:transcriptional regulator with XRE-family HTH domain